VATALGAPAFDAPTVAPPPEPSRKSLARRAGVLYLIACLPAPFALVYVRARLFVAGDPRRPRTASAADRQSVRLRWPGICRTPTVCCNVLQLL